MSKSLLEYKGKLVGKPTLGYDIEKIRWLCDYYNLDIKEVHHSIDVLSLLFYGKFYSSVTQNPFLTRIFNIGLFINKPDRYSFGNNDRKVVEFFNPLIEEKYSLLDEDHKKTINYKIFQKLLTTTTSYAYGNLSHDKKLFEKTLTSNVSVIEKYFTKCIIRPLLKKKFGNQEALSKNYQSIKDAFDKSDAILSDGREFINKKRFSYLDLEFCSIVAPNIMVPEYGGKKELLPDIDSLPENFKQQIQELRNTSTGKYVLNIYKKYRNLNYKNLSNNI